MDDRTLRIPMTRPFAVLPESICASQYYAIVPVDFDPPAVSMVDLDLDRGATRRVSFGLIPLGSVRGRVVHDGVTGQFVASRWVGPWVTWFDRRFR